MNSNKRYEHKTKSKLKFSETKFEYEPKIKVNEKKLEKLQKMKEQFEQKENNTKEYLSKELPKKWWKKSEVKKKIETKKFKYEPEIKINEKKMNKLSQILEDLNSKLSRTRKPKNL